jgi:hypothetical protein
MERKRGKTERRTNKCRKLYSITARTKNHRSIPHYSHLEAYWIISNSL